MVRAASTGVVRAAARRAGVQPARAGDGARSPFDHGHWCGIRPVPRVRCTRWLDRLASASIGFAIGRWTGLGRIERVGGTRVTRIVQSLERNGTLAVFLLRKIPAPFLIANIVAGASRVSYRDFIVGTVLGMTAIVVALAGFGYQLTNILHSPSPMTVLGAVVFIGIPLTLAWFINRVLRQPGQTA